MDETDIASVEFSTIPFRCTLKNSSKERDTPRTRGINYGQDEDERKKERRAEKRGPRGRTIRGEGGCEASAEKSLEGFGSADAYNRPSLSSNKTHSSISPSEKYRFRATFTLGASRLFENSAEAELAPRRFNITH